MAVAHDASASAYSLGGVTSASWSHTASGSDRYVRVGIGDGGSATNQVSAITYAGAAMAQVGNIESGSSGYACIYEKIAPSTGAQTVSITFSAAAYGAAGSSSYTGVHQTTASGAAQTATSGSASSISVNVSSAPGDMVSDCVKHYHATENPVVGAGQTQRWQGDDGSFNENAATSDEAGAATVTMSWSASTGAWALVASNIIQSSGAASTSFPFQRNPMAHMLIR